MIKTDFIDKEEITVSMWCWAVTLSKFQPFTWEVHKVQIDAIRTEAEHVFNDIEIRTPKGVRCNPLIGRVSGMMVSHWYLFANKAAALQAAVKFNRYDAMELMKRAAIQNIELKKYGKAVEE